MKKLFILFFSLIAYTLQAETPAASEPSATLLGLPFPVGLGLLIIMLFILVIIVLLKGIMIDFGRYAYNEIKKSGKPVTGIVKLFGIFEGDFTSVTSEYQDQVIHEYDGIQEYDNDLPPWWKAGFYITVVFAVAYLFIYHVVEMAPLQTEEYNTEIAEAKILYADIDQVYDAPLSEPAELEEAAAIFQKSCKACHGADGGGTVGPNLTDKYWLHGGNVNEVYNTVKYGVIEKGMKAWKSEYSNDQIYQISSYILSLQGTKPATPKEPQGDLVE